MEHIPLRPWRQTWLSHDLLHASPAAGLCVIEGKQWAQLEHPRGGPLGCVQNRTGRTATGVSRVDGKWCWSFDLELPETVRV